jgi:uncharacterized protein YecE (DUF72 family)
MSTCKEAPDCSRPGRVELIPAVAPSGAVTSCPVEVGTCGYSYTEWIDSGFYPRGTRTVDMLALYSRCFSIVELNYTWYQMARADALERMVDKSPPQLRFAAKLTRTMTHERADDWREQLVRYRGGIKPLVDRDRLLAILIQLPPDFDRSLVNRSYLGALLDGLQGLPVAVEFRHSSWAIDTVFAELERRRVTLVAVDEPSLPGLFPSPGCGDQPRALLCSFSRTQQGWMALR